jgi:S1-C subfamily serine protease
VISNGRHRWTFAVIALALVGCGSCSSGSRSDADIARSAAVRVEAEGCHMAPSVGAGSFVADERVLTVAHVVAGSIEVDVIFADGTEHQATVVAIDRQKDLALLAVTARAPRLSTGRMQSGAQGVMVVWRDGKPVALTFTTRSVVDINAADIDRTTTGLRRGYELDVPVEPGDSGSVLVANGLAVGVLFARSTQDKGRAWATDIVEADALLHTTNATEVDTGSCS